MKICPKCATENADTAKFCNECGTILEIKETKALETVKDTEPVSETPKEDVSPAENEEPSPVTVAETVSDNQESATEQTEKKEEQSPKKKNRLIIGIVAAALICIIGFMATRPKIHSLKIVYNGGREAGVVLDEDNTGFAVTAVYSDGKTKEIPLGEWTIKEPKTLECDTTSNVIIAYKGITSEISIPCSETKLQYITATYNGSTYEGTIINKNSKIDVVGTFGSGQTKDYDNTAWYYDPPSTTLKKGVESKIKVLMDFVDGSTMSADLVITGTEKPFTNPKIEGDHYNFSAEQLAAYLESDLGYVFSADRQTKIGDSYFYHVTSANNAVSQPFSFEIRENANEKVNYVAFTSNDNDIMVGLDTSISLARALGGTMKSVEKNDMTFQMFMIAKMHSSDDTLIECYDQSDGTGYVFYVMPYDYRKTFWEELNNK